MESNTKESERCCQHNRLTAGFFVNLLINILIVCVGTFYLMQFSQELRSLKEENQVLRGEVKLFREFSSGDDIYQADMSSGQLVKREVLSSPSQLVAKFEQQVSALQLSVDNIDAKVKKYHPQDADLSCPSTHRLNPYTGTCVRFVKSPTSWFDAKFNCEAAGEKLATFDTIESAAWYRQQQVAAGWAGDSWIGGRKVGSTWTWHGILTGPITMSYWAVGEPNSDYSCLATYGISSHHYHWDNQPCNRKQSYACERIASN